MKQLYCLFSILSLDTLINLLTFYSQFSLFFYKPKSTQGQKHRRLRGHNFCWHIYWNWVPLLIHCFVKIERTKHLWDTNEEIVFATRQQSQNDTFLTKFTWELTRDSWLEFFSCQATLNHRVALWWNHLKHHWFWDDAERLSYTGVSCSILE